MTPTLEITRDGHPRLEFPQDEVNPGICWISTPAGKEEMYHFWDRADLGGYELENTGNGKRYFVKVLAGRAAGCSCPDKEHRKVAVCKHENAVNKTLLPLW